MSLTFVYTIFTESVTEIGIEDQYRKADGNTPASIDFSCTLSNGQHLDARSLIYNVDGGTTLDGITENIMTLAGFKGLGKNDPTIMNMEVSQRMAYVASLLRSYNITSITIDIGKFGKVTLPLKNFRSAATINAMLNDAAKKTGYKSIYGKVLTDDNTSSNSHSSGNISSNSGSTTVPHTAPQTTMAKKTAEIISMKTRHSEKEKGTYVTVDFFIHNMKGKTGGINAYFYFNDGTPLKDINKNEVFQYSTSSGNVAVGSRFTPDHDHLHYTAYELFIPDSELHLAAGNYVLKYYCAIFDDGGKQIATSKWQTLSFSSTGLTSSTQKSAKVLAMDAEHNVMVNGQKGMNILVDFDVNGMNGKRGEVIAYFYFDDKKTPLKDFNKRNYTVNGNVCASEYYEPPYDNAKYTKFKIFIPYSELHLNSGHYSLKYYCVIFDDSSKELTRSDWQGMSYTKN